MANTFTNDQGQVIMVDVMSDNSIHVTIKTPRGSNSSSTRSYITSIDDLKKIIDIASSVVQSK